MCCCMDGCTYVFLVWYGWETFDTEDMGKVIQKREHKMEESGGGGI